MATVEQIVKYWSFEQDECGLGVDWSEGHQRCWRCGYERNLQKCHIVPKALGGSDGPDNLVLLCLQCHREAPNSSNPEYMWIWLRANNAPMYDMYWTLRGFHEFERMFGRKPFEGAEEDFSREEIEKVMRMEIRKTAVHGGEAGLNPSTIACVVAEMELRFGYRASRSV